MNENTDPRFAWIEEFGGPAVTWENAHRHSVSGAGLAGDWHASEAGERDHLTIRMHQQTDAGQLRILSLDRSRRQDAANVQWEATLKVGESRYVRAHGSADDFPTAATAVLSHQFPTREFGGLTWWEEIPGTAWKSWLGRTELEARRIIPSDGEKAAYWVYRASGEADTLEEAALMATLGRTAV